MWRVKQRKHWHFVSTQRSHLCGFICTMALSWSGFLFEGPGAPSKGELLCFFPSFPFGQVQAFTGGTPWIQLLVSKGPSVMNPSCCARNSPCGLRPVWWGYFHGAATKELQFGLRLQGLHQGLPLTQDSCTIILPCEKKNKTSKKDSKTADVLSVNFYCSVSMLSSSYFCLINTFLFLSAPLLIPRHKWVWNWDPWLSRWSNVLELLRRLPMLSQKPLWAALHQNLGEVSNLPPLCFFPLCFLPF